MRVMVFVKATEDSEKGEQGPQWVRRKPAVPGPGVILPESRPLENLSGWKSDIDPPPAI